MKGGVRKGGWVAGLVFLVLAGPACAGPPYVTDDPAPTDLHHWEIYNFASGVREAGQLDYDAGLDLNYGAAPDLQITFVLPAHKAPGNGFRAGDTEIAAKYRILHQTPDAPSADVAIFPRLFLPTGAGSRHAQLLLPVWAGRDFGKTGVFGGGGYVINPGAGNRNFWVGGAAVTRQISESAQLGVEYHVEGPDAVGQRATRGINLGAALRLIGPYSLLGSLGHTLRGGQTSFYLSLKLDL